MKHYLSLLMLLAFSRATFASSDLSVNCLFDADSRVPNTLIPFQLTGSVASQPLRVTSVQLISSSPGADCRVMKDPYIASNVLLKCRAAATVTFRILGSTADETAISFNIGPVQVKDPLGMVQISPSATPGPGTLQGKQLYSANCVSCHNPPSTRKGSTAAQITSALSSVSQMKITTLQALSAGDIQAIADYLVAP